MYPLLDKPTIDISSDQAQYFTPEKDSSADSPELTEQQRAAMSQLLDIWILEFEEVYGEYVQGDEECLNQPLQDRVTRQFSI